MAFMIGLYIVLLVYDHILDIGVHIYWREGIL